MSDIIDDAQEYNELYQKVAFENQRAKNKPEFDERFNGKDCAECGDTMPAERIAAYRVLCTQCQSDKEQRDRLFAR